MRESNFQVGEPIDILFSSWGK